jgi:hypothetical protein
MASAMGAGNGWVVSPMPREMSLASGFAARYSCIRHQSRHCGECRQPKPAGRASPAARWQHSNRTRRALTGTVLWLLGSAGHRDLNPKS